mgnify:FL=1|tara:strand:+ start:152 stop:808 length:657 start_codon:yes stop_codon:yes gene_type:complete
MSKYLPIHQFTTNPLPSRHKDERGESLYYARFNFLPRGKDSQACVSFKQSNADLIKKGGLFSTDNTQIAGQKYVTKIKWNDEWKTEELVFENQSSCSDNQMEENYSESPEDFREQGGYNDDDAITAGPPQVKIKPSSQSGWRDRTTNIAMDAESRLASQSPEFKYIVDQVIDAMIYASHRLGVKPAFSPGEIQRAVVSCAINGKHSLWQGQNEISQSL